MTVKNAKRQVHSTPGACASEPENVCSLPAASPTKLDSWTSLLVRHSFRTDVTPTSSHLKLKGGTLTGRFCQTSLRPGDVLSDTILRVWLTANL